MNMMKFSWLAHITDRALSNDAKRRFRLTQTAVASLMTISSIASLLCVAASALAPWPAVLLWSLVVICGCVGFLVTIRSGWSERFADPSMTLAQMAFAITCCAAAYAITGAARGAIFPLAMVVMMFGMFSSTPRRIAIVSAYAIFLFGLVMWTMAQREPVVFVPAVESIHFLMLTATIAVTAVMALQLRRLRSRLQQQKRALAHALERNLFLATRDELTGLVNRRQMSELLEREQLRAVRSGTHFSIALIDLDHFKRVNDSYGHAAGDAVLRAFAKEAVRLIRGTDIVGRWGGEEFLLLMPHSALPMASQGAERLRHGISELALKIGTAEIKVTLSAGVVQHGLGESFARTIERADLALYRAKAEGRDRILAA